MSYDIHSVVSEVAQLSSVTADINLMTLVHTFLFENCTAIDSNVSNCAEGSCWVWLTQSGGDRPDTSRPRAALLYGYCILSTERAVSIKALTNAESKCQHHVG